MFFFQLYFFYSSNSLCFVIVCQPAIIIQDKILTTTGGVPNNQKREVGSMVGCLMVGQLNSLNLDVSDLVARGSDVSIGCDQC